jgi:hypothetical protein
LTDAQRAAKAAEKEAKEKAYRKTQSAISKARMANFFRPATPQAAPQAVPTGLQQPQAARTGPLQPQAANLPSITRGDKRMEMPQDPSPLLNISTISREITDGFENIRMEWNDEELSEEEDDADSGNEMDDPTETGSESEDDDESAAASYSGVIADYLESIKLQLSNTTSSIRRRIDSGDVLIHPPDPLYSLSRMRLTSEGYRPDPFYLPDVYVWAPHLAWKSSWGWLKCPDCFNSMTVKGWQTNPSFRKVVGVDRCFYLCSYVYVCASCKKSLTGSSSEALSQAPHFIQRAFPAALTKRLAISNQVSPSSLI